MGPTQPIRLTQIAFAIAAWTFLACLGIQLFLVGVDVFEVPGAPDGLHRQFAYVYGWIMPLLVLLAVASRAPRRIVAITAATLALFAFQTWLPLMADEIRWLAAVHGLNAALIVVLTWTVARSASRSAQLASNGGA